MKEKMILSTLEEIKTFSDPYRLQILTTYRRFNRPATVKEIADKLKETPAKVHYHVKKLEKVNILELVQTREINGIIAKYYQLTAEKFILNHSEHDEELNKVILSEKQRVISNLYDQSKRTVVEEIMKKADDMENKKGPGELVQSFITYMSKEDATELAKLIHKISSKHHTDEEKKDLVKYHMFSALMPLNDDDVK